MIAAGSFIRQSKRLRIINQCQENTGSGVNREKRQPVSAASRHWESEMERLLKFGKNGS